MRMTLNIDDDLLAAAKSLARARPQSAGRVLSDLARSGLEAAACAAHKREGGFPVFDAEPGAHPISSDDVNRLEDEE